MQSASDVISSLFGCKEPAEQNEENEEEQVLEQFVQSVDDFSSQYGSEISVSYTAFNLRGPPSNFPDYGDYPQAFVMVRDLSELNYLQNIIFLNALVYTRKSRKFAQISHSQSFNYKQIIVNNLL